MGVEPTIKEQETISFPVTGMTCTACQARVQRALAAAPGVVDASVNLLTNTAAVRYDPAAIDPQRRVDAVRATGYDAELPPAQPVPTLQPLAEAQEADEARGLAIKASVSIGVGIIAMAASMTMMASPLANYVLLAVTSAILIWAARDIYRRAWKAALHRSADMNTLIALGTGSAFIYSVVATVSPALFARNGLAPDVYYEAVVFIIALVLAGRAIEARARRRTSDALRRLITLLPPMARVERGGE